MTPDSRLTTHDSFMHRCIELAKLGSGYVAPNPMVGAVLVYDGRIIGEGWHKKFGEAHAEVNCINSVKEEDKLFISRSTLYVSLEPCNHFGKTPPCTDLIIKNKIQKVVVGCLDPSAEVNGKGIEKLRASGVEVETGILEEECKELNKRFFTFHTLHRPYIILKWAQTSDGFMAPRPPLTPPTGENSTQSSLDEKTLQKKNTLNAKHSFTSEYSEIPPSGGGGGRLLISNEYTNRLVHKWRSEEASILVGTNTALMDDPELTNRLWNGPSPIRLVVDVDLSLPKNLKLFDGQQSTIIFNTIKHSDESEWSSPSPLERGQGVRSFYYQVTEDASLVHQIVNALYQLKIQSVLVEGGARLLQSFIDEGMWDEIRKIENRNLKIENGLAAPEFGNALKIDEKNILSDKIEIFKRV